MFFWLPGNIKKRNIQGVREKHRNIQTAVRAKHNKQLSLSKDFVILTKKITKVGLMQEKRSFFERRGSDISCSGQE